jgi:hypothetical protein
MTLPDDTPGKPDADASGEQVRELLRGVDDLSARRTETARKLRPLSEELQRRADDLERGK